MGRYSGKTCRLLSMLVLTGGFFLVEIVVGYVTNSIALVADSFHMLSDVVALIVGFASIRIARWPSRQNTYGWVRSEILGAMFNAVFLLALCFSITVEALKRLVTPEPIERPILLLAVGSAGLVVNIIGLLLFHGHVHGHSHDGKKEGNGKDELLGESESLFQGMNFDDGGNGDKLDTDKDGSRPNGPNANIELTTFHGHSHGQDGESKKNSATSQMNMKGVFLHVLGDALGSVVVIVSSLVIWLAEGSWRFYVDPAMSIGMVIIILCTTVPLLKETSLILLQTAPSSVDQDKLKAELEKFDGVLGVHEFHLWQLTTNRLVLSAHITCHNLRDYMTIAAKVKDFFHRVGIHSTTIQPEFVDLQSDYSIVCNLKCATTDCIKDTCCGPTTKTLKSRSSRVDFDSASPASSTTTNVASYMSASNDKAGTSVDATNNAAVLSPDATKQVVVQGDAPITITVPDPDRETNL